MKLPPHSKDLRKGRYSEVNARYFITFKTRAPSKALTCQRYYHSFQKLVSQIAGEGQISEASYTIMPDHVHMLLRLGATLSLSQVVGKLKQLTRKSSGLDPLNWQVGYHDHKLRNDGELHPIVHYMYMNPYRAQLQKTGETWPFTHIYPNTWKWFQPLLQKDCPYPSWLAE